MDLTDAVQVSASGLRAQSLRMRVIAENLANADSVSASPGGDPYRRRVASFSADVDRANGTNGVKIRSVDADKTAFQRAYQPGSPAADAKGYVLMPNVNPLIEAADMKAAQRAYEANLNAIEAAKSLTMRTIDLLK
ncbi:flagellar basal-body rod protein FlgC [Sphingomonas sp. PP-CE-3A-406]|jgi:flagellar basal-body rod protein FlgC|uniref:flagellar basal body rod protein FlgC n=1 Tax=unclassified Sphingomonas TaxID=196159 RepID=UPI00071318A8|nr:MULTISPECIES: flagellar basal body rod protein FlgC [unclassified Sphingomonas]KQO05461.1 flagellar basal-body rod protein FlgC [Sphingomonas sp. Leaf242]RMB34167.1 flagellar basal-body rod protein FlgC [Sphingomonas sp. PP-F2F-G114-C0414]RMB52302.1 flagellar basal-body rod protein FlgC [Sphingomonas sp. PP-CE-3A-406]